MQMYIDLNAINDVKYIGKLLAMFFNRNDHDYAMISRVGEDEYEISRIALFKDEQ